MVKYALSGDESAARSTLKFKKHDEIESKNSLFTVMPEPKRKPRPQPAPYNRQKEKQGKKDAPATSAKAKHDNLTLHDWMTVFAFIDAHMPQAQVVTHFKTRQDSALVFDQSTLSRKLKERET
jgi:hypothetical protein